MFVFLQSGGDTMNYKKIIIELLSKTEDEELLELSYRFCRKLLG